MVLTCLSLTVVVWHHVLAGRDDQEHRAVAGRVPHVVAGRVPHVGADRVPHVGADRVHRSVAGRVHHGVAGQEHHAVGVVVPPAGHLL